MRKAGIRNGKGRYRWWKSIILIGFRRTTPDGPTKMKTLAGYHRTPPCIRLKTRVDLGDQTAEFIPFEVIRTAIFTYFYLFLDINLRILISVIKTRFQPDIYTVDESQVSLI